MQKLMGKQVNINLKIAFQEQSWCLLNVSIKENIGKRKFYLFKQYINGMLSSKSSEKSRAFGHPLSTTLNNARHLSSNV